MKKLNRILMFALTAAPLLASAQWSAVRFDSTNVFQHVHAVTPNDAYLLGNESMAFAGFLLRTHDGGLTWDSLPLNTAADTFQLSELQFIDVTNGFAGGGKNNVHQALIKTANDGASWTDITPEPTSMEPIGSLYFVDETRGFATAGETFYATADGGITWSASNVNFIASDLKFLDDNVGFAAGTSVLSNEGVVLKTTDGGATWLTLFSATDPNVFVNAFNMLNAANANVVFLQQDYTNTLYRTVDGGSTWDTITCDSVWQIIDFHFNDVNNGYLLSGYGQLYSTTDGGVSWTLDYTAEWGFYGPSVMFHSLSFSNGTGYVCGSSGLIKRFEKNTNGIVEHENLTTALNVFPNPCYGATNLNVNATGMRGDCVLAIVNGIGQVVFEKVIRNVHHQPVFNVTGLSLPAGTYGVALRSEDQTMSTMIVITD